MGRGDDVPLRPGPVVEFWRERDVDCGCVVLVLATAPCAVPRVRSAVVEGREDRDARAEALREDVADEERWWRR